MPCERGLGKLEAALNWVTCAKLIYHPRASSTHRTVNRKWKFETKTPEKNNLSRQPWLILLEPGKGSSPKQNCPKKCEDLKIFYISIFLSCGATFINTVAYVWVCEFGSLCVPNFLLLAFDWRFAPILASNVLLAMIFVNGSHVLLVIIFVDGQKDRHTDRHIV